MVIQQITIMITSTTPEAQEAIKELIIINNDRKNGYHTAAEEAKDGDLKALFSKYSNMSAGFANELKKHISQENAPDPDETKLSGKMYRAWMDIKAALSTNNRKAVLESCEFGEDVALKTYKDTLDDKELFLTSDVHTIIQQQRTELESAHNYIKSLKDNA
jgi:uncharacterized protein (TIGR02284 family)